MPKIIKYQAARYLRLSRDDGDKPESDSISTQRCMINDFVSNYSDIEIVDEMVDDGYSGSNFDRPGFTKLIEAIKERKINCIIVKDLSRFSRDYIGSGMYIMNLFPKWGVRLIAINDNYDSLNASSVNDELMFSFKSIVNDLYLRDISVKIRSHLEVKRKSGQYMGAFVAYGYMKDPNDKHKIVIDENVSDNIKKIFSWVTDGMSPYSIAEKLNSLGILSPAEYKKSVGINHNGFDSKGDKANWSAQAVMRIVKNELYKGTLVQGKRTTVSHKVKLIVEKEKKDWATVQGSHPAIVSEELFRIANDILGRDTRASSKRSDCNIFSGMLFCEDCKNTMVRRTSKYKDSQYVYYRCSTHKNTGECSNHNISESDLYDIVLNAINTHIKLIIGLKKAVDMLADNSFMSDNVKKINKLIEEKQEEIKKRKKDLFLTHQSYCDGILTADDFKDFKAIYEEQINSANLAIGKLIEERSTFEKSLDAQCGWMTNFTENEGIKKLNHKLLVMMVDKIFISSDKKVRVVFMYQNEFEHISEIINATEKMNALSERVG